MKKTIFTLLLMLAADSESSASPVNFSCDVTKGRECETNARSMLTSVFANLMSPGANKRLKDRAPTSYDRDQIRENLLRACTGDPAVCRDFAQQTIAYLTDESVTSLPNLDAVKKKYAQQGAASATGKTSSNPLSLDRFKNMKQAIPLKSVAPGRAPGSQVVRKPR